jgi:hypothetical protein
MTKSQSDPFFFHDVATAWFESGAALAYRQTQFYSLSAERLMQAFAAIDPAEKTQLIYIALTTCADVMTHEENPIVRQEAHDVFTELLRQMWNKEALENERRQDAKYGKYSFMGDFN